MLSLLLAAALLGAPDDPPPLTAGVAEVEITPPESYRRLGGYFKDRFWTEVRDPLYTRALVLSQGTVSLLLVTTDLCGIPAGITGPARQEISKRTGIPAEAISVTASHTHTGPYLNRGLGASEGKGDASEAEYAALLRERLVACATKAFEARRASVLRAGTTPQAPQVSRNRRNLFKDGQVRSIGPVTRDLPDHDPRNIVETAGPIDPDLGLIFVGDPGADTPRAALTVFALHCNTVGNTRVGENVVSADYPGAMARELRKSFGPAFVNLFGAGTCGDINYVDPHTPTVRSHEEIGALLASTTIAARPKLADVDAPRLGVRRSVTELPLRKCTDEEIERSRRDLAPDSKASFYARVEALSILEVHISKKPTYPIEIQAMRVSKDVALVLLPGEIFVELGLEIRKRSPFRTTIVIELTNDNVPAYIPTRKACAQAGYEVFHSLLAPGSGEVMVEEALRLLGEVNR
ncbi:MAG TPA: hypothetical protein VNM14_10030 [Planctomycetota bacterium]|nr:hypothetical protein [Planctomycetota bacterium]